MSTSTRRDLLREFDRRYCLRGIPVTTSAPQTGGTKKIIVAGGGIGGLCCGYELMKRGHEVTVLEAAGRSGGHILTVRDRLADGLYADGGAEHFYRPGYDMFWRYIDEFHLPVIAYPRREHMVHYIGGRPHTEEMLADRSVLKKLELNQKEIDYLVQHPWAEFSQLYYGPYLDDFKDEYRPFDAGLNDLDHLSVTAFLQKQGASAAAIGLIGGKASALNAIWFSAIKNRGEGDRRPGN